MPKAMQFTKGSIIYFEGDRDDRIYIVQSGSVLLSGTEMESGMAVAEHIKNGEFFGVKSALGHFQREETATALVPTVAVALTVQEFEILFSNNKPLIMKMLRVFSNQLRQIHKKIESTLNNIKQDQQTGMFAVAKSFYDDEEYRSCCVVGTEAKTVMDEEAREILLDYIDYYYYSDYSEEMFFSKSFSDSADRIMTVNQNRMWVVGVFIVAAVILYILYKWWRKRKQHKLDEMNAAEKILGSDLGEFGTYNAGASAGAYNPSSPESDIDELKKKYDN